MRRDQNVSKPVTQGSVMGEAGRSRPVFQATPGKRAVKIFSGPRDNFEETIGEYLDDHGAIRGEVAHETSNHVIVEYPIETFQANQKAAEDLAAARVTRAAPVGDASVHQNTVGQGRTDTLEAHLIAGAAEHSKPSSFDQ